MKFELDNELRYEGSKEKDKNMETTKTERISIDLPQDILFAMRGLEKPEEVKKKLKIALAILLFQEGSIPLGKATELTEMSRVRFMEVLREHGIPAYEYGEKSFKKDQQVIARYRKAVAK
jgi:predicted HTH domain antitoxin